MSARRPSAPTGRRSSGVPAALVATLLGLGAFTAFVLIRPLFGDGAYYRPRTGVATSYNWLVLPLFVPYALTLRAIRRGRQVSTRVILAGAAVVAIPLVVAPLLLSQDLYQYLFYGKMRLVYGANPYTVVPRAFATDPWYHFERWPDQLSVYGPVWLLASEGIVAAAGRHLNAAFLLTKALAFGLGALAVWGIVRVWRRRDEEDHGERSAAAPYDSGTFAVAAFVLNPLVLTTIALGAHADAAVAACFVWAVWADRRDRPLVATVLLTLAGLVKAYGAIPLIVYVFARWRRAGAGEAARLAGVAVALSALAFWPLWAGSDTFRGLLHIAGQDSSSLAAAVQGVVARLLRSVGRHGVTATSAAAVRWGGAVALAVTAVGLARSRRTVGEPWRAAGILFAVFLLVTPWCRPWYTVALIALMACIPSDPVLAGAMAFSGTSLITANRFLGPVGQAAVRYGVPALAYRRSRRRLRSAGSSIPAG